MDTTRSTHGTLLSLLLAAACSDVNTRAGTRRPDVDGLLASVRWALHVWTPRANPRGLLAPWNPRVRS